MFRIDKKRLEKIRKKFELFEIINSYRNYTIYKALKTTIADIKKVDNKPVICVGSGYSLNEGIEQLKQWKHDVICSVSQFSTLAYHGIKPKFIISSDPFSFEEEYAIDWGDRKFNFVLPVSFNSEMITKLLHGGNKIYFYIRKEKRCEYLDTIQNGFCEVAKDFQEKIKWSKKDVIPELNVTYHAMGMEIKLAEYLGYNPIILIGSDLIINRSDAWYFKNDKWECTKYDTSCMGQAIMLWERFKKRNEKEEFISKTMKYKGRFTTNLLYIAKKAIDKAIKESKCRIIDCSSGILEGCEKGKLSKIVEEYNG